MGQQSLIYSFVARGTVILAEFTEFTGNFTGVAAQCLQKLPSSNNKFTYNCDGHTFNYLVDNGFSNSSLSLSIYVYIYISTCYLVLLICFRFLILLCSFSEPDSVRLSARAVVNQRRLMKIGRVKSRIDVSNMICPIFINFGCAMSVTS